MERIGCGFAATSERRNRTAQGYRRFRCRDCDQQFKERSGGLLNRTQYPSDIIVLVVLWRLRYRLMIQDLGEMFLARGIIFSDEAVQDWKAKQSSLLPSPPSFGSAVVARVEPDDACGTSMKHI
ncbi:hypothetical protein [Teichococcus wenyumeiae]|uniref:hypothetical protein n=1 Tax=Teichococcus wenyumeiae TaxID=2478470 RepID=UPI001F1C76AC|nr:hypothetical protein [Pseudoroseomonas wenyumeiae]